MPSFLPKKFHFGRVRQSKKPKEEQQPSKEKEKLPGSEKDRLPKPKNQCLRPPRLVRLRRTPTPSAAAAAATTATTSFPTPTPTPPTTTKPVTKPAATTTTDIRESRTERNSNRRLKIKSSDRSTTALAIYTGNNNNYNPFTSFPVETWMKITIFLSRRDISHLRLASLGIRPRHAAVTLHPALTSHLNLNLDYAPWYDWVWKSDSTSIHQQQRGYEDDNQLARAWCRRDGIIDFPRDISNAELEIFIHHKEYLSRAKKVSFGRCRNLTVDWFEECLPTLSHLEYIEICLPPHINNEELSRCLPHLIHVTRLNCVGCSQLNEYGFELIGQLKQLKELYFLHW